MPSIRDITFVNDYIYHICNRGVERRRLFEHVYDSRRFVQISKFYTHESPSLSFSKFKNLSAFNKKIYLESLELTPNIVDVLCYCLMPNHFHLLLRQRKDNGISQFVSNISNSYTKYFNTKYHRVGPLYQGPFKAVFIESEEQLLHVSRYIHINPAASSLINQTQLDQYEWSSLPRYLSTEKSDFLDTETILSKFKDKKSFADFTFNQIDHAIQLENIKHLTLEE